MDDLASSAGRSGSTAAEGKSNRPGRFLRTGASLLIVLLAFAGAYAVYFRYQIRETRERNLRALGSTANHVETVVDNTRRNLDNLLANLDTFDHFVKRQPYLEFLGDPGERGRVRGLRSLKGSSVLLQPEPGQLLARLGPLRVSTSPAYLFQPTRGGLDPVNLASDGQTRLENRAAGITLTGLVENRTWSVAPSSALDFFIGSQDRPVEVEVLRDGGPRLRAGGISRRLPLDGAIARWPEGPESLRPATDGQWVASSRSLPAAVALPDSLRSQLEALGIAHELVWEGQTCGFWVFHQDLPLVRLDESQVEKLGGEAALEGLELRAVGGIGGRRLFSPGTGSRAPLRRDQWEKVEGPRDELIVARAYCHLVAIVRPTEDVPFSVIGGPVGSADGDGLGVLPARFRISRGATGYDLRGRKRHADIPFDFHPAGTKQSRFEESGLHLTLTPDMKAAGVYSIEGLTLLEPPEEPEQANSDQGQLAKPELTFRVRFEEILASIPLPHEFESYLVAYRDQGEARWEVLHQEWPGGETGLRLLTLPDEDASGGSPRSTVGVPFRTSFSLSRADSEEKGKVPGGGYEITCQPLRVRARADPSADPVPLNLVVCGVTRPSASLLRSLGFSPHLTALLLFLAVVVLLSLPLLKLLLMDRYQRFRRQDVLLLVVCTFTLVALLTAVPLALHRYQRLSSTLNRSLEDIAVKLESNLKKNFCHCYQELRALDRCYVDELEEPGRCLGERYAELTPGSREHIQRRAHILTDVLKKRASEADGCDYFSMASWINQDGWQVAKWTVRDETTPLVMVGEREYFRAVRDSRLWSLEDGACKGAAALSPPGRSEAATTRPAFAFQTFASMTTGKRSSALSFASAARGEEPDTPRVAALHGWGLPPLGFTPVVSPPLGFAVVDASGLVWFHSDPRRASYENLYEKVSEPERLRSVIEASRPVAFNTHYLGRPHRLRAAKMTRLPLWVVTFYDRELLWTLLVDAMVLTLLLTALYALILLVTVVPFRRRLIRLFRPTRERIPAYAVLALLHFGMIATVLALNRFLASHGWLLLGTVAIAVGASLTTLALLQGRPGLHRLLTLLDKVLRRIGASGPEGKNRLGPQTACTIALLLFWALLAVVPLVVFSRVAWDLTRSAALDFELASTGEQLRARAEDIRSELLGVEPAPDTLRRRLERRDDLFLYSLVAQSLIPAGGEGEIESTPESRISQVISRVAAALPIYNRTSRSLRHRQAGKSLRSELYPWPVVASSQSGSADESTAGGGGAPPGELLLIGWDESVGVGDLAVALPLTRDDLAPHWTALLAFCAVLLVPLALWLSVVSQRLFFLGATSLEPASPADAAKAERLVLITCSTSAWRRQLPEDGFHRIDLASRRRPLTPEEPWIVCERFEDGLEDPELRSRNLELLQHWVREKKKVTLITSRNPLEALGVSPPEPSWRWRRPTESTDSPPIPCSERRQWAEFLSDFTILNAHLEGPGETGDRQVYWWCVWGALTADEQLALMQLAIDGLLNPKLGRPLELLAQKGLVDPMPLPSIKHPGLEAFVRSLVKTRYEEEWQEATTRGDWRNYQRYLAGGAALLLAILLITERDLFNYVTAIATALAAGVAGIVRLLGSWRQPMGQ